jgi:hypothetical protein
MENANTCCSHICCHHVATNTLGQTAVEDGLELVLQRLLLPDIKQQHGLLLCQAQYMYLYIVAALFQDVVVRYFAERLFKKHKMLHVCQDYFLCIIYYIHIYYIYIFILLLYTSGPRPRVAVALPGDCLALNVRLNDIVTFLAVFVLSRKNSSFTQPIVGLLLTSQNCVNTNRSRT